MNKKAYIAGKISGVPLGVTKEKFNNAADKLRTMGYEPIHGFEINNVDVDNHTKSWDECMRADIKAMLECDTIVLLPCWQESRGAQLERDIAVRLGIQAVYF